MESLPNDAITKIAAYLCPKDLLTCSIVCKKWREKFNTDNVWAPRLIFTEEYYNIQGKYKDMILCPPDYTNLQSLCVARECYIRDQCLRFNWRAGLFTVERLLPKADSVVYQIVNHLDKDGNYWLFLATSHLIEVWNVTNKPCFQSCAIKKLPIDSDSLHVLETKVFLVYNNFVQVFSFEHPKYELIVLCCFFINHESPDDIDELRKTDFSNPGLKHIVTGNILIGYFGMIMKSMLPAARLHVWNMDILVKLDTVKMIYEPMSHCFDDEEELDEKNCIAFQIFKGDYKNVLVVSNDYTGSTLTIFDLEELKFLDFLKPYNKVAIFWGKMADERIVLMGVLQRVTFFVTIADFHGSDIVVKNLTKQAGIDNASQFYVTDSGVYVKTVNELWFVGSEGDSLTVNSLINKLFDSFEQNKKINLITIGHFMFTQHEDEFTKMWDLDEKCQIRDLLISIDKLHFQIKSLPDVEFPPKVVFANTEGCAIKIISFW